MMRKSPQLGWLSLWLVALLQFCYISALANSSENVLEDVVTAFLVSNIIALHTKQRLMTYASQCIGESLAHLQEERLTQKLNGRIRMLRISSPNNLWLPLLQSLTHLLPMFQVVLLMIIQAKTSLPHQWEQLTSSSQWPMLIQLSRSQSSQATTQLTPTSNLPTNRITPTCSKNRVQLTI
jgi:hypothetical protein